MLVLSRKRRESVVVGVEIGAGVLLRVTVMDVRGGTVRLGFDGELPVHRWEVWERMRAGTGQAARLPPQAPIGSDAGSRPEKIGKGRGAENIGSRKGQNIPGTGVEVCVTSTAGNRKN